MDYFNIAFSSPYPFLSVVSKGLTDSKGCPMDSFNSVFSHACPSIITFVFKGLKESKRCLMDCFNTVFNHVCPSLPFVSKGVMDSKRVKDVLWTPLTMPLVLLVHPFLLVSKGLKDSKECSIDSI